MCTVGAPIFLARGNLGYKLVMHWLVIFVVIGVVNKVNHSNQSSSPHKTSLPPWNNQPDHHQSIWSEPQMQAPLVTQAEGKAERSTIATAPRSGQLRMTNDQDLCELEKVLNKNPWMKMAEVKDILTTPISTKTTLCNSTGHLTHMELLG
ncbi:uncharacterized protein PGTG_07952 [Puccinia graminis f. sp. tritici CRL 75-36-700-3]|uniref:Uncharacterized protein n=1 Tax=Puccinia graminis f. sp. tritici (strain CRL 75-36-700-3 / race SCCL) TaxID=418459 RepID=E3KBN2_PUCGT|nr:uncharacterized protein PGTG_07952 [Puccinia graminis f. sp. tritici CRL 75-36-700-3]EFP81703.1 hypothetical protein PGTG_07952 [Puccinia graminis f. sp. tritici CRL 75-36-700-3]